MKYIADLHIHSPYSRATSRWSNLPGLAAWSAIKGIDVIGTGDFTHPGWFSELRENLQPAEPGFYKLKDPGVPQVLESVKTGRGGKCRFVLTAEISSIYKRHGSVRKIHNIIFVPDFDAASRINTRLASIGNIESDGRPILGLDARDLLEIVLESAPEGFLVPAHIWTPWFSLFGSRSGFDDIDECFADLSRHIFALETGLSSDPGMNRLVSALDRFTLISNSDCHSPGKLGREANIFACGFNFFSMRDALKNPGLGGFQGTVEFFPEEGKYHHDGHRKCSINLDPLETRKIGNICPVCSKPLTIGVMHRVLELADRKEPHYPPNSPPYYSLIPLAEVLGEIFSRGPSTKTVMNEYGKLVNMFDSEFNILLNVSTDEISERYSPVLGEAVKRIRKGKVIRHAGFDGEFGVIKVFEKGELKQLVGQYSLFTDKKTKKKSDPSTGPSLPEFTAVRHDIKPEIPLASLNEEQSVAVASQARHIAVKAGPGTGKTFTLVSRIRRLLAEDGVKPSDITAITFTNRAAGEMRERLDGAPGLDGGEPFIGTFHGFCLNLLRTEERDLAVVDAAGRDRIIASLLPRLSSGNTDGIKAMIESHYRALVSGSLQELVQELNGSAGIYLQELAARNAIDLDGIIPRVVYQLKTEESFQHRVSSSLKYLFIDEFQDLNEVQYELVRILAAGSSVFAIGDPDQAIYGFRGSRPEFFYHFIEEFGAETITLARNYRSAQKILQAASAVIAQNHDPEKGIPGLIPESSSPGAIEFFQAASPRSEAEYVVRRIEDLVGGISHLSINAGRGGRIANSPETGFSDFAVLYRVTQQARYLREALESRGIPFQMVNVKPFFMHSEVRPLYYWIRAAGSDSEPSDAQVYLELLSLLPGVGKSTLENLEKQLPLGSFTDFFSLASRLVLPKRLADGIDDLQQNLMAFRNAIADRGLSGSIKKSMNYLRVNRKNEDAGRFLELAGSFGTDLAGFAGYLHKNESATVYDEKAEAVALMTLHGAKGLEFPAVFITGMEEGILPCSLHGEEMADATAAEGVTSVQEERRLFYVGMTRARDFLILTSSVTRPIFGSYKSRPVSRFIREIPESFCEMVRQDRAGKKKPGARQMKLF